MDLGFHNKRLIRLFKLSKNLKSRASIFPVTVKSVTVDFSLSLSKVESEPAVVTFIVFDTCAKTIVTKIVKTAVNKSFFIMYFQFLIFKDDNAKIFFKERCFTM